MYFPYGSSQAPADRKCGEPVHSALQARNEVASAMDGGVRLRRRGPVSHDDAEHLNTIDEARAVEPDCKKGEVGRRPIVVHHAILSGVRIIADFAAIGLGVYLVDLVQGGVATIAAGSWYISLLFVALQAASGAYKPDASPEVTASASGILSSWLLVTLIAASAGWAVDGHLSPASLIGAVLAGAAATLVGRTVLGWALRAGLRRGRIALRKAQLISIRPQIPLDDLLAAFRGNGVDIAGISSLPAGDMSRPSFARACEDCVSRLRAALQGSAFDEVYILVPWERQALLHQLVGALGRLPVPVFVIPDAETERLLPVPSFCIGRLKAFEVQRPPRSGLALKRALDVTVAVGAVILFAPLLIGVSLAILATSGRPVIFRQERQGFCGKRFKIYKFRTMRVCEDGPAIRQATADDPRVTPLGLVLRRLSIDELPQLLNVLKGDMSIVGPRPHAVAHDEYYSQFIKTYFCRQYAKPGLTGWAQLHGFRGETKEISDMEERVKLDLWYIENWSIFLDIRIMLRTALVVLFDKAAY